MNRYALVYWVTDKRRGWKLGNRVVPRGFTIRVSKYFKVRARRLRSVDLSDDEIEALRAGAPPADDWMVGERDWLELDVESTPTQPPRCVALRAPSGISTPEQRFPLTGVVVQTTARGRDQGRHLPWTPPTALEYEDMLFEANRARGRKRARSAITPERLEEVARIALEHPRTPTEAVKRHFGISRGYARRLIKRAKDAGYD